MGLLPGQLAKTALSDLREDAREGNMTTQTTKAEDFLKEFYAFYSQISQLVQGWKQTTPKDEWTEWDEQVWQELQILGRKAHKALHPQECNEDGETLYVKTWGMP